MTSAPVMWATAKAVRSTGLVAAELSIAAATVLIRWPAARRGVVLVCGHRVEHRPRFVGAEMFIKDGQENVFFSLEMQEEDRQQAQELRAEILELVGVAALADTVECPTGGRRLHLYLRHPGGTAL